MRPGYLGQSHRVKILPSSVHTIGRGSSGLGRASQRSRGGLFYLSSPKAYLLVASLALQMKLALFQNQQCPKSSVLPCLLRRHLPPTLLWATATYTFFSIHGPQDLCMCCSRPLDPVFFFFFPDLHLSTLFQVSVQMSPHIKILNNLNNMGQ